MEIIETNEINGVEVKAVRMKYKDTVQQQGKMVPFEFMASSKEYIDDLIKNRTRCVCIYNNITELRVSTVAHKYMFVQAEDVCGCIRSIDYDAREVEIEFTPECCDPNSYRYINPDDYDKYELKIRGLSERVAGDGNVDKALVKFIAFDLLKSE